MPIDLTAAADDDGRRLDRILRKALPDMPLSAIHRLLRKGGVLVDGKAASADYRVREGQTIMVTDNLYQENLNHGVTQSKTRSFTEKKQRTSLKLRSCLPQADSSTPCKAPCSPWLACSDMILFEGAGLLVLNKPAGLPVHGRGSLEDLVRSYLAPKLSPSLSFRPGPLHRLDRPSSGIIAFSTSLEGARFFSAMMRNRMIKKQYLALVSGVIEKAEIWEDELVRDERRKKTFRGQTAAAIHGASRPGETKTALTRVSPLLGDGVCTLILAEIETGRTHQIRAQASGRGHPLFGDKKYGGFVIKNNAAKDDVIKDGALNFGGGFLLHAWRMEFPEKAGVDLDYGYDKSLPRRIEAPLPEIFLEKIQDFFGEGIINNRLSHL